MWCRRAAQIKPHHDAYKVVLSLPGEMTVSADINRSLFTITGSDLCFKHYIQYGGSFLSWRPAQIGPHHGSFEFEVLLLCETMTMRFIFFILQAECKEEKEERKA
jgi:hypothetical protein